MVTAEYNCITKRVYLSEFDRYINLTLNEDGFVRLIKRLSIKYGNFTVDKVDDNSVFVNFPETEEV